MANTRYENFVLENRLKDQLITKLNMVDDVTVDDSLNAEAGMTKKVHVYNATGAAQKVAEGEGNTESIEMSYTDKQYTVGTTQARFIYTDEDEMTDPYLVDGGIQNLSTALVNVITGDVVKEWEKASQVVEYEGAITYDHFVDALALLNREDNASGSEENGANTPFARVNPKTKALLRKSLKDELKYVEDHVRTGYIGTVCGIPIRATKAVPEGEVIIATKAAVTYFRKKSTEVEQDRDKNTRKNILYGRDVGFVALTDENECVLIKPKA